ncbi:MAG: ComEC/Rec2 family competence protein [Candidatus Buchananbacteria bacterium]
MFAWSKAKIFFWCNLLFLLGVAVARWWFIPAVGLVLVIVGLFGGLLFFWRQKTYRVAIILAIFLLAGFWRYQASLPINSANQISYYNGQEVRVVGTVCQEPDERSNHVRLTFCTKEMLVPQATALSGKILIKSTLYPKYQYGDQLKLKCELFAPQNLTNQTTGQVFDYEKYLARYDIYATCWQPEITLLAHHQGNFLLVAIYQLKNNFLNIINQLLTEPAAAFLAGLLLGQRQGIAPELMLAFNTLGITHILAISGYNITILAVLLSEIGYWFYFSRQQVFWLVTFGLIFFVIVTGASASVVRAAVMGWLVILAQRLGRLSQMQYVLALTAALMVWLNPKILWWDVGWQLSFVATLGLVYLNPVLVKIFNRLPNFGPVKETLVTTLSAVLLTTPLSLYYFGRLPLLSPLANLLILPVIPWAMALGLIMVLLGSWWLGLGKLVGFMVYLVLSYIVVVAKNLASISFAAVSFKIGWWWVAVGYLAIYGIYFKLRQLKIKML